MKPPIVHMLTKPTSGVCKFLYLSINQEFHGAVTYQNTSTSRLDTHPSEGHPRTAGRSISLQYLRIQSAMLS